ncbi:MAG: hypothetical protein ACQESP_10905 [Candidatus Muiribacteriota bacterium]
MKIKLPLIFLLCLFMLASAGCRKRKRTQTIEYFDKNDVKIIEHTTEELILKKELQRQKEVTPVITIGTPEFQENNQEEED